MKNIHVHSQTLCSQHDTTACAQATSERQQRQKKIREWQNFSTKSACCWTILLSYMYVYFDVHRYGSFPLEMNSFHPSNTRIMAWIRVYHQNLNSQNWYLGNGKDGAKYHPRVNYPFKKRLNSAIHVKDFSNIMQHTKNRTAGWWMQSPFLFYCTTNAGLCP